MIQKTSNFNYIGTSRHSEKHNLQLLVVMFYKSYFSLMRTKISYSSNFYVKITCILFSPKICYRRQAVKMLNSNENSLFKNKRWRENVRTYKEKDLTTNLNRGVGGIWAFVLCFVFPLFWFCTFLYPISPID